MVVPGEDGENGEDTPDVPEEYLEPEVEEAEDESEEEGEVASQEDQVVEDEDGSEVEDEVDSEDNAPDKVFRYRIPLESVGGALTPAYDPSSNGEVLLNLYGTTHLTILQTRPTPHFHNESVNVQVTEFPYEDVAASNDLVRDFA